MGIKNWFQTVKMRICYKASMSDVAEFLRATSSVQELLQGIRFLRYQSPWWPSVSLWDQLLAQFHAEPRVTAASSLKFGWVSWEKTKIWPNVTAALGWFWAGSLSSILKCWTPAWHDSKEICHRFFECCKCLDSVSSIFSIMLTDNTNKTLHTSIYL